MAKRKPGERWREMGRTQRMLNAKRTGTKVVPDKVLKKLASLGLPNNKWVYDVCLRELLRGA